jgi:predicted nucleic acid-binding protein
VVSRARSLLEGLGDQPVLAVDTAPVIYWLEGHPRYAARFASVFEAAETGHANVVVSTVTVAEVLAGPIKAGDELLTSRYREALTRSPGWQVVAFDVEMAVEAARIRARYRLRLPDAIQVATAIRAGAAALVTHDRALRRVRGLKVVGPE